MKRALYFGCLDRSGHFLHGGRTSTLQPEHEGLPWSIRHLDGGLLENGGVSDEVTGRVHWTCGQRDGVLWYAFYWWDRSGDPRGASNSGFYVSGFDVNQPEAAFAYARSQWPQIVERQKRPLVLDGVPATQLADEAEGLARALAALLVANKERMTDEQRIELLGIALKGWCLACGAPEPCYCASQYDE